MEKIIQAANDSQSTLQIEDVLVTAKRLGKTILRVDNFIPYLNNELKRRTAATKDPRTKKFPHPCIPVLFLDQFTVMDIIVEDISGAYKPLIKEFPPDKQNNSTVPILNLDIPVPLLSPFFTTEEALLIVKKKEERTLQQTPSQSTTIGFVTKKAGLCEACNLKFSDLEEVCNLQIILFLFSTETLRNIMLLVQMSRIGWKLTPFWLQ